MKTVGIWILAVMIGFAAGDLAYRVCVRLYLPPNPMHTQEFSRILRDSAGGRMSTELARVSAELSTYVAEESRITGRIGIFASFLEFLLSAAFFARFSNKKWLFAAWITFIPVWGMGTCALMSVISTSRHLPMSATVRMLDVPFILSSIAGLIAAFAGSRLGWIWRCKVIAPAR